MSNSPLSMFNNLCAKCAIHIFDWLTL